MTIPLGGDVYASEIGTSSIPLFLIRKYVISKPHSVAKNRKFAVTQGVVLNLYQLHQLISAVPKLIEFATKESSVTNTSKSDVGVQVQMNGLGKKEDTPLQDNTITLCAKAKEATRRKRKAVKENVPKRKIH